MKFIHLTWFVFIAHTTFSQIPDSTLAIVFENVQPEQILKLLATNQNQSERIADYRYELGFKIPSLNPFSFRSVRTSLFSAKADRFLYCAISSETSKVVGTILTRVSAKTKASWVISQNGLYRLLIVLSQEYSTCF